MTDPLRKVDIPQMLGSAYPAFQRLQEWGCNDLRSLVIYLHLPSVPSIRGDGRQLQFRGADLHETLLNGISLRTARQRIKQARVALESFTSALAPLDDTPIWQRIDVIRGDREYAIQFLSACVDALSKSLDETGPKAHPDANKAIERVVKYVKEITGQYHDSEVAEVVAAAIGYPPPTGYPSFPSAEAMKMWREKNGLTDRKDGKTKVTKR